MARTTNTFTALGKRVRELRKARGLSLAELGRMVGVTRAALSIIELGRRLPSTHLIVRLEEALGCQRGDLVSLLPPEHPTRSVVAAEIPVAGQPGRVLRLGALWVGCVAVPTDDGDYTIVRPGQSGQPEQPLGRVRLCK